MNVIVVGSGLVGVSLALALAKAGHHPTLYDQVDLVQTALEAKPGTLATVDFGDVGGSVMVQAAGMKVLKSLGVFDEVDAAGKRATSITYSKIDGSSQYGLDPGAIASSEPDPSLRLPIQILRGKLHHILTVACQKLGVKMFTSKKILSLEQTETGVTCKFTDGTTAYGDLLAGADGIHSKTRRLLFGEELKARFIGNIGYIGVCNTKEHNITIDKECAFYIDRFHKRDMMTFKVSDDRDAFFVGTFAEPDAEATDDWRPYSDLPKHSALLSAMVKSWGVPKSCVSLIEKAYRVTPATMYDLDDLPSFVKGRVFLIGDSAHGMPTNAGLGLSTGLMDVGVLYELMQKFPEPSQIDTVLSYYNKLRVEHSHAIAAESRGMAKQTYSDSKFGAAVGHLVFRFVCFGMNHSWIPFPNVYDCKVEVEKALADAGKPSVSTERPSVAK
ncbi:hypothetical protein HDU83_009355 [Entophlyctis luteolus]|nr:hypothetical protein HDU83_009355 [Entophlyctis luteolus]